MRWRWRSSAVGKGEGIEAAGFRHSADRCRHRASRRRVSAQTNVMRDDRTPRSKRIVEANAPPACCREKCRIQKLENPMLRGFDGGDVAIENPAMPDEVSCRVFAEEPPILPVRFLDYCHRAPALRSAARCWYTSGNRARTSSAVQAEEVDDHRAARLGRKVAAVAIGLDVTLQPGPSPSPRCSASRRRDDEARAVELHARRTQALVGHQRTGRGDVHPTVRSALIMPLRSAKSSIGSSVSSSASLHDLTSTSLAPRRPRDRHRDPHGGGVLAALVQGWSGTANTRLIGVLAVQVPLDRLGAGTPG